MFDVSQLNPEQQEAVLVNEGPVLVLAGAGTGKTRVITQRIIRLLDEQVPPERIMAVTFTKRAAREMNDRIFSARHGFQYTRGRALPWCGTFHALGVKYMQMMHGLRFAVMDEDDAARLAKLILEEQNIDKKILAPKDFLRAYSYARNTGEDFVELMTRWESPIDELQLQVVAEAYRARKEMAGVKDFDDLLEHWLEVLVEDAENGRRFFDYILVDEYQDTNYLQACILKQLNRMCGNLMAVGDDAQSIYSFRGSQVQNIHEFELAYPGAKIITLHRNYRSGQPILDVANRLWAESSEGYEKQLVATDDAVAEKPQLTVCESDYGQNLKVMDAINKGLSQGRSLSEMAVLFRSAFHSIKLEMILRQNRIPYKKWGGMSVADSAHFKDFQAILRCMVSRKDEPAWLRFLQLLPGVGEKSAVKIFRKIAVNTGDFEQLFTAKQRPGVVPFLPFLKEELPAGSTGKWEKLGDLLEEVKSVYSEIMYEKYEKAENREKELDAFISCSTDFVDLREFLNTFFLEDDDTYLGDEDRDQEFLTLSTVHSAKGCEWDQVLVIHLADGNFPSKRAMEEGQIEEERRLLYVAMTRARKQLNLFYPKMVSAGGMKSMPAPPCSFLTQPVMAKIAQAGRNFRKSSMRKVSYGDVVYDYEDY